MAIRQIQTEHVRAHELSDRAVPLPNALDHDRQSRYGVKAKTGMWITYREKRAFPDGTGQVSMYRSGRVLGRVEAPFVAGSKPEYDCERVDGSVSVLALSDNMQFAYVRWVKPEEVVEVSTKPPAKLLAWITGELPTADLVHKLSAYGTLSESYIHLVEHHINAWKHGVSPAAWDAGVRSPNKE